MGKGTNQIATWSDLYSIGYRVPTSYRYSKECITYQNLEDLGLSTNILEKTSNAALNTSYFNGNTTTGFTFTRSSDIKTFEDELPSLGILANTAGVSSTNYTVLGTLGSLYVNEPVELRTPELRIYLTMIPVRDVPTGTLYYRLTIRSGSSMGSVVSESSWRPYNVTDVEVMQLRYYFDDPILISVSSGRTYYLVVEWYTDLSYTSRGIFVSFKINESFSKWDCYCPNKCVPWNRIKGYNGQTLSAIDTVKVPVKCYIEEAVSGSIAAQTFEFRYEYQLSGSSTWDSITTGTLKLQTSSGQIQGSAQGTCYVLINPKVSGTVVADRLAVFCGTLPSGKYWRWKTEYSNSTPTSWSIPSSDAKYISFRVYMGTPTTKNYNSDLRNLTGFYYRILDSI